MSDDRVTTAVLDPVTVAELTDSGVPGLLEELTSLFSEDAPRSLARLRSAMEHGDATEVARVAHALKGSAATLGARVMASVCAALETDALAGRTDAWARLATLEEQMSAVLRALAELASGGAPGSGNAGCGH
jgi:HPt (histidine-containing phosphotransfer) domain-containing protein